MKLSLVHFDDLVPIPRSDRREDRFYASDGWSIDRLEDGRVRLERDGPAFWVDGFACTYEEAPEVVVPSLPPLDLGGLYDVPTPEPFLGVVRETMPGPESSGMSVMLPPKRRGRPRKA